MDTLLNERLEAFKNLPIDKAFTAYSQLRVFESDYDKAQSTLRTIASAWILAAIGAVGLVIQAEATTGPNRLESFVAAPLRQALLLAAGLGVASLWYLDQRVYQRLLHSVYSLGCHLEIVHKELLPIRSRAYLQNLDITWHLGLFYRAPLMLFLGAAIISLVHSMFGLHAIVVGLSNCSFPRRAMFQDWALPGAITAMHLGFFWMLWRWSKQWPSLDPLLPTELIAARIER